MNKKVELEFPCKFPIKVMGKAIPEFEAAVITIINKHAPNLPEGAITINQSKEGNYTAITIVVDAQSKEQLDNIYRELTSCEYVIMAL